MSLEMNLFYFEEQKFGSDAIKLASIFHKNFELSPSLSFHSVDTPNM